MEPPNGIWFRLNTITINREKIENPDGRFSGVIHRQQNLIGGCCLRSIDISGHGKHLGYSSSIGGAAVDVSDRPVVASCLIVGSEGVRGVWVVFLDQSPQRKG
ncbi:unnamed protein product [Lactuca virosa]|uniref:Uncharacterized protein n=1 Tax=Lactuca virosa TaxID=75947 RepID=A0AAU9NUA6_9ASTR|nr:unnamed protein product [Lactuca virosa]